MEIWHKGRELADKRVPANAMVVLQMFLFSFVALPVVAYLFRQLHGPWKMLTYSVAVNMAVLLSVNGIGSPEGSPSRILDTLLVAFCVLSPIGCMFQAIFNNLLRPEGPIPDHSHKLTWEEVDMYGGAQEVVIADVPSPY
ncbi:MAG: hypothetical protein U0176_18400 [Bacteroidia bacterium]